ncbi:MAG TPA: S9 family peptidase [Sphingomicrobium sp.]|nr:S9 family peptidase [Sphingomicrobium sp.]
MMRLIFIAMLAAGSAAALGQPAPVPPVAAKKAHVVKGPADRVDEYYWLRDDTRKDPQVLAYLNAENAYADAVMAPLRPLQDQLYAEIVGRIKQDDASVPALDRGYYYYTRYETGSSYPILARRKGSMAAPEEILLNQPEMAKGHDFFSVSNWAVSPDNRLLAYVEDVVGRRQYRLKVKDLATGQTLADSVANVEPDIVWADDNRTIYYIDKDPVTLLSKRVKAHVLGTQASTDRLVYEEKDDTYYIGLGRTSDDRFICIQLRATVSSEYRCASAANPVSFGALAPRQRDHLYDADHAAGRWVIRTNLNAPNYRLVTADDATPAPSGWRDLVAHDPNVFIEDFKPFDRFIAIEERAGGNKRLRLLTGAGRSSVVTSDEPAFTMALGDNHETATTKVRYTYDSMTAPTITYEVDALSGERTILKRNPAPGYDPSLYVTERVWAPARDGARIPVSLVYRKGFKRDGTAALLQYGYGAYGYSSDPAWRETVPSLLDRGMVYAIAHVRGGQEMGRAWYDQGHLLNKKNSFTDFIDVTRYLVAQGYAAKDRVAAQGGSAGGLLMGAVMNMAPQDYDVLIAQVPFADAVTTMLDASIPLTSNEWDEWGNPANRQHYDYILSYSPYDQVQAKAYPATFVGTGLWDSQVQYFEPAKWVARLRARKTDSNPLLFRTNMDAGHGGKSGRFERYRSIAEYYAFMLNELGVAAPVSGVQPGERGR